MSKGDWKAKVIHTALVGIFLVATNTVAQTNSFTFTNVMGEAIRVEPIRVQDGRLIYRNESGGGSIRMGELPADIQKQFGYDQREAAVANAQERRRKELADMQAARDLAAAARLQEYREITRKVEETRTVIWARVMQRLDGGLLIDADSVRESESELRRIGTHIEGHNGEKVRNSAEGIIMLCDYSKEKMTADGDKFAVIGFPIGFYEYSSVGAGKKTVRRYTTDLKKAVLAAMHRDR